DHNQNCKVQEWVGTFGPIEVSDDRGTLAGWTVYMALDDFPQTPESGATIIPGVPYPKVESGSHLPQQAPFHLCDDRGCVGVVMMAPSGTGGGGWFVTGKVIVMSNEVRHNAKGQPVINLDVSLTKTFDKN
ncbi:MAG TPA: hypothetical protein VKY15_04940, partial [Acidimicrobiales bacterium]|nr:hypothetical protein [Acidimicrobiales bacterium]